MFFGDWATGQTTHGAIKKKLSMNTSTDSSESGGFEIVVVRTCAHFLERLCHKWLHSLVVPRPSKGVGVDRSVMTNDVSRRVRLLWNS